MTRAKKGGYQQLEKTTVLAPKLWFVLKNGQPVLNGCSPNGGASGIVAICPQPRATRPHVFAEKDGRPISKNKVSMAFKRAARKAGIKDFRLHDLRHQFASYLTMGGQNQRTLMQLLGHKDPKMTTRYQHLSNEHLRAAVECLDTRQHAGAGT